MNTFKSYNPIVNFLYFALVIFFSMFIMNPFFLFISVFFGAVGVLSLGGIKKLFSALRLIIPIAAAAAAVNVLCNHAGGTILCYLPDGNPLTAESLIYSAASSAMLCGVILHFSCFNELMTSDRLMYLFGRMLPSLSLIFSMVLRFVPRFKRRLKSVADAQRCLHRGASDRTVIGKLKNSTAVLSIMITKSLEGSIETADSMKSRGYGLPKRTSFANFIFKRRDAALVLLLVLPGLYIVYCMLSGGLDFSYFPYISSELPPNIGAASAAYAFIYFIPFICDMAAICKNSNRRLCEWIRLKSKK